MLLMAPIKMCMETQYLVRMKQIRFHLVLRLNAKMGPIVLAKAAVAPVHIMGE